MLFQVSQWQVTDELRLSFYLLNFLLHQKPVATWSLYLVFQSTIDKPEIVDAILFFYYK